MLRPSQIKIFNQENLHVKINQRTENIFNTTHNLVFDGIVLYTVLSLAFFFTQTKYY